MEHLREKECIAHFLVCYLININYFSLKKIMYVVNY